MLGQGYLYAFTQFDVDSSTRFLSRAGQTDGQTDKRTVTEAIEHRNHEGQRGTCNVSTIAVHAAILHYFGVWGYVWLFSYFRCKP